MYTLQLGSTSLNQTGLKLGKSPDSKAHILLKLGTSLNHIGEYEF